MNLDPSAFVADPQLVRALEDRSTPISCLREQVLFRQGEPPLGLYIVHRGEVTLSMDSRQGNSLMTFQATSGSLLGLPGLIGNEPYTLTATALGGAQLRFVDRDSFLSLMQSDPLLSLKVLQVLAAEVRSARSAILER